MVCLFQAYLDYGLFISVMGSVNDKPKGVVFIVSRGTKQAQEGAFCYLIFCINRCVCMPNFLH